MIMNISKVAPTERRWSGSDHRITLAKAQPPFATDPNGQIETRIVVMREFSLSIPRKGHYNLIGDMFEDMIFPVAKRRMELCPECSLAVPGKT